MSDLFHERLTAAQDTVAAGMRDALSGRLGVLPEAMLYAIEGGKCLRAFLALESARLHGVDGRAAALAIEAVHAYSLIHDDLPCMDDDDFRRGKPTVHRKWDETIAILAGDALNTLAFELLANGDALPLVGPLARAAGTEGMIGGQMMDIAAETADTPLDLARITALQAGKTGALVTWSALVGPRLAKADQAALHAYGDALGLAFQIADDLLDVEGDADAVGKAVRKDAKAGKATFVSLMGLEMARARADALVTEACDALAPYGAAADPLRDAARFVVTRNR